MLIQSIDDKESIRRAGRLLREGAIVAFPTETVYVLGAKAEKAALARLDTAKGRDTRKRHYSLHIGSRQDLTRYVPRPTLQAEKIMHRLWPGPLTIIFEPDSHSLEKAQAALPPETYELLYQEGSLAVRYPANSAACAVLLEAVAPVIATSATPAAGTPAVNAEQVAAYFDGRIDMIVDAPGACRYPLGTSIVKIGGGGVEVLREGAYSRTQIREAATINILFVCTGNTCRSPMAEALCRKYFADKYKCDLDAVSSLGYTIGSAGVAAFEAMPASCHALQVSRQRGTPLDNHRSRGLTEAMVRQADLIFVMNQAHLNAVTDAVADAAGKSYLLDASGAIADPAGYDFGVYCACAEQIERCIQERMNELL